MSKSSKKKQQQSKQQGGEASGESGETAISSITSNTQEEELQQQDQQEQQHDDGEMDAQTAQILQMLKQQNIIADMNSNSQQPQTISGRTAQHMLGNLVAIDAASGDKKSHAFWDTQPMIPGEEGAAKADDDVELHAPIVPNKEKSELRQEPFNMPKGFEWSDLDVSKEDDIQQVYDLLAKNYVEDDDCMFRFDYSTDFLRWALTPPNYSTHLHVGVRSSTSKKLMAFISAVPADIRVHEKIAPMVEINFLCVHKKLRAKRLAPVLIKEITRRVNHTGVFQAVYTAGVVLPTPVSSCRYYHRSLDPKKLVEVQFSRLPPRMTMARFQKLYRLPKEVTTANLRPMTPEDVKSAHSLLTNHLKKFSLTVEFSVDDFAHWLLPREGVIYSYVACNNKEDSSIVTDMISFYVLPSTIIGNQKHSHLNAAYNFYNVATTVDLTSLVRDALVLAKIQDMDVYNALNQMENGSFLDELKFGMGDGNLQYYLYNWCCPTMDAKDVGIVLL